MYKTIHQRFTGYSGVTGRNKNKLQFYRLLPILEFWAARSLKYCMWPENPLSSHAFCGRRGLGSIGVKLRIFQPKRRCEPTPFVGEAIQTAKKKWYLRLKLDCHAQQRALDSQWRRGFPIFFLSLTPMLSSPTSSPCEGAHSFYSITYNVAPESRGSRCSIDLCNVQDVSLEV